MNESNQILFSRYLSGEMDAAQRKDFQSRLDNDPLLKSDFELFQMMEAHLGERHQNKAALDNLKSVHQDQTVGGGSSNRSLWIKIIALLVFLAAFLFFEFYLMNRKPANVIDYASLYEAPAWPTEKGAASDAIGSAISKALNGNQDQAIADLKLIDTLAAEKNYWIAELFAKSSQVDSVLNYLPESSDDPIRRDRINYLRILAHYQKADVDMVRTLISNLPTDTDSWYMDVYEKLK